MPLDYVDPEHMSSPLPLFFSSISLAEQPYREQLFFSLSHISSNSSQRFRCTAVRLHFSQARGQKPHNTFTSPCSPHYGYVICDPFMIRVVAGNFMGVQNVIRDLERQAQGLRVSRNPVEIFTRCAANHRSNTGRCSDQRTRLQTVKTLQNRWCDFTFVQFEFRTLSADHSSNASRVRDLSNQL